MRRYIITGASGFVGNNLIRMIDERRKTRTASDAHAPTVRALVRHEGRCASLAGLDCEVIHGDITKLATLSALFDPKGIEPDDDVVVIHCAGVIEIGSKPNPAVHAVDVVGTANVIAATEELGRTLGTVPKLMYVGSVHAIPEKPHGQQMSEPSSFDPHLVVGQYAKAKAEASQLVLDAFERDGIEGCILMPSGIIGPFDFSPESMKRLVFEVAKGKLPACVEGGYDFVDVRDVCAGLLAACDKGQNGESYILSNRSVSIREICDCVCDFVGRPHMRIVLPVWLAKAAAPLAEVYYRIHRRVPLYTSYALLTLQANSDFSHEKAFRDLGYSPRPLQETVFDMVAWMETQPGWEQ